MLACSAAIHGLRQAVLGSGNEGNSEHHTDIIRGSTYFGCLDSKRNRQMGLDLGRDFVLDLRRDLTFDLSFDLFSK